MSGLWKRPVAAGWYVGSGLALLLVGLPAQLLGNIWTRGTLITLGVLCLMGAAYEWWFRTVPTDLESKPSPDVFLESSQGLSFQRAGYDSLESVDFVVYNDSSGATALDVEVSTLSSGNYRAGYWTGDAATPAGPVTVSTTLRFEPVPHLDGKRRASVQPINPVFSTQEKMLREIKGIVPAFWWFVDRCRQRREEEETAQVPEEEREAAAARFRAAPIDIPITLTYSDVARKRHWRRAEMLHYDPATLTAHIRHGDRQEVVKSTEAATGPVAVVSLLCDRDRAELRVRNDGPVADFWGTLRIKGDVRRFVDTTNLLCRWPHTASVRTRIARGQECRIILAENVRVRDIGPTYGCSMWHIYGWSGDRLVIVESLWSSTPFSRPPAEAPDIILEGEIVADPDLQNGLQPFRVVLRAFEAVPGDLGA